MALSSCAWALALLLQNLLGQTSTSQVTCPLHHIWSQTPSEPSGDSDCNFLDKTFKGTALNWQVGADNLKLTKPILIIVCISVLLLGVQPALGWSNNGYSDNPAQPKYGTHDWIAQHALDYLPTQEKKYITDNLAAYLYGTELPDNSHASDGIGDTTKHHVYYSAAGALTDNASAQRANSEYNLALNFLKAKNYADAAKTAGTMTHYIADLAVFGHVMGSSTAWGSETHHSDYEDYVNTRTTSYTSNFNTYLSYDGSLTTLSAYNVAVNIAYETTFGGNNHLTCVWMDDNYNWNNPTFSSRCGQSLNLAVNSIADVLHTLYQEAAPIPTPTTVPLPTNSLTPTPTLSPSPTSTLNSSSTPTVPEFLTIQILTLAMLTVMAVAIVYKKTLPKTS
ncbi:MAG: zinc dependent phospholipase C family protein [Candidatus Bathyarchaeota archaeon]|nr:zinc dependent phospholipase C family protein [Candidatus Bathyarchaeota archaeon]